MSNIMEYYNKAQILIDNGYTFDPIEEVVEKLIKIDENKTGSKIISIETEKYNGDVYDLEVEKNHNYFVQNHLVHNCHQLVLEGLFGKTMKVTTTKKLQDADTLAQLQISMLHLEYDFETKKLVSGAKYQDEVDFLVRYEKRNKFIKNLALKQDGNTLVLFQFVEKHGKVLYNMIKDAAAEDRKVFFVSGDVETADREAIRRITEGQTNAIIVASFGTFSTGINIRNIHNIIFASPSKSQVRVLQSIGRGLRKSDDNRETKLFDIMDDLNHGRSKNNYSFIHAEERLKIYKREKFNVKIHKVKI